MSDRDEYLDEVHDSRFFKGLPIGLLFSAAMVVVIGGTPWAVVLLA